MGLEDRPTDFGITLGVWGVPEGQYVVHPVIGPSTERDTIGMIVDRVLDPVAWVAKEKYPYVALGAGVAGAIGARSAYAEALEALIYGSADSYAQARLIYLENRRFEVRGRKVLSEPGPQEDPYAELYDLPYSE